LGCSGLKITGEAVSWQRLHVLKSCRIRSVILVWRTGVVARLCSRKMKCPAW